MSITISIISTLLCLLVSLSSSIIIPLPFGTRAEGITHAAGSNFLVADFFTGNLYLIDVYSRLITTAVRAPPGRITAGIYATRDYFFGAGGGTLQSTASMLPAPIPSLYVYDVVTGAPAATCAIPDGGFVNDVVANSKYAYYTDSIRGKIYQLGLNSMPECNVTEISLPKDSFAGDGIRANGIQIFRGGLIVVNGALKPLFFVDLRNGNKVSMIQPQGAFVNADGLEIVHKKRESLLYVAQNFLGLVSVWKLSIENRIVTAKLIRTIKNEKEFATPTTVAVSKNRLVVANFNFRAPFSFPINQTFTVTYLRL